jgi:hypothetical protein
MCSSSQLNCRLRPANGPCDIVTEDVPKCIRALLQKCEGSIRGSGEADGEQYVVYNTLLIGHTSTLPLITLPQSSYRGCRFWKHRR